MFDVGWSELLLIGIVALIVIGPEDLPRMFRTLGRITAKARGMAREFSMAMDDAARSSGIEDATKSLRDVKAMTSTKALGLDALDRAADKFEKWDPKLPRAGARAQPDPSSPGPSGSGPSGSDPSGPAAVPAPIAANAAAGPAADPSVSADPAMSAHTVTTLRPVPGSSPATPPAAEAPGRRRLHAVRRSDPKDS